MLRMVLRIGLKYLVCFNIIFYKRHFLDFNIFISINKDPMMGLWFISLKIFIISEENTLEICNIFLFLRANGHENVNVLLLGPVLQLE